MMSRRFSGKYDAYEIDVEKDCEDVEINGQNYYLVKNEKIIEIIDSKQKQIEFTTHGYIILEMEKSDLFNAAIIVKGGDCLFLDEG